MAKTPALNDVRPERDQAVDRRDNWLESENAFFDATVSGTERTIDTEPRDDAPSSVADPSAGKGRIMMIGFHVIRV